MKKSLILSELKEHYPFTLFASFSAVVFIFIFWIFDFFSSSFFASGFEFLHPLHVFVSAGATASLFYKYRKSFFFGILVGIVGSILIGTLSDVLFPYISGNVFGFETALHIPVFEESFLILGSAFFGSLIGILFGFFNLHHFIHVLTSVLASIFYLIGYSLNFGFFSFVLIILIVFVVVLIPCCVSDIVFPLWFVRKRRSKKVC